MYSKSDGRTNDSIFALEPLGASQHSSHFGLDGFQQLKDVNEKWEGTELRHELFKKEWDHISSRIEVHQ